MVCLRGATLVLAVLWSLVMPDASAAEAAVSHRLPEGVLPALGCWFWTEEEFAPNGYRAFIDLTSRHAAYNLLTTSIRAPLKEVADPAVHAQIKAAAAYAREHGMGVVMDLDVRLARSAFQKAHPDELQQMLRLREVKLSDAGQARLRITSENLRDHYTFRTTDYIPVAGQLVRVYSYMRGADGIEPATMLDITRERCKVKSATAKEVTVVIACDARTAGRTACVMVAFTHFTPAVFAPHLLEFQRQLIKSYGDAPLAGVCKDEWGFPPCFDGCPAKNDYWFSPFRAQAYAKRTGGRDLLRDCLLMTHGERGRSRERQVAINHFLDMSTHRNGAIEHDFYRATKDTFGPKAVVATHPTWWPYPGTREFKKNGLSWWQATRDLAQVDEVTPVACRTSLAKKWGSAVWYNMYYSRAVVDYETSIWSHALGGGRVNFHPIYPSPAKRGWRRRALLQGSLMRGDCRIRLLNFITRAPLDCPVAVIFGHACAMNWAGPSYDDVGLGVTNGLWRAGFPADLIPSSEIGGPALKVSENGYVQYGPQRYAAVVLYHPEFERPGTATFFRRGAGGKTAFHRVGEWTATFDGKPFDGRQALPGAMQAREDAGACVRAVVNQLKQFGVKPQSAAAATLGGFGHQSAAPGRTGHCRLLDGTEILLAGTKDVAGDPIRTTLNVGGHEVTVDAIGVVGVRLRTDGSLAALAAGGLKHFAVGGVTFQLDRPADLALWRDAKGELHGVLQGWEGPVPPSLSALTTDWLRLAVPPPLPE